MDAGKVSSRMASDDGFLLEDFAPFQLAVVANRVSAAIARVIDRKFNLHIPEWRMLCALAKYQPCSAQMVVEKTAMEPARVSRAQTRLVDLGMIDVRQDPGDRRRVIINLTDKGAAIVDEMVPDAMEAETFLFGALTDEERSVFERSLAKLFDRTEELERDGR